MARDSANRSVRRVYLLLWVWMLAKLVLGFFRPFVLFRTLICNCFEIVVIVFELCY